MQEILSWLFTGETGTIILGVFSLSFDDFGNDTGKRGTTQSRIGTPQLLRVRKCVSCGHSHT